MCGEGPLTFLSEKPRRGSSRWIFCLIHLRPGDNEEVRACCRWIVVACRMGKLYDDACCNVSGMIVGSNSAFCVKKRGPKEVRGGPINRSIEKRGEPGLFFFAPETGRNANETGSAWCSSPSCALRLIIINLITSSLMETIDTDKRRQGSQRGKH